MAARPTADVPALIVVDASVLVELVIAGRHRAGADALLDRLAGEPPATMVTAAHGLVEAVSALRRLARSGAIEADAATRALTWLEAFDIVLDAPAPRLARIWALRDRMSAYDAAYAACAEALVRPLLSTDARLLDACVQAGIAAGHLESM